MDYMLGFIADRVGVPSKNKQKELLQEHGLGLVDIYDNLGDCLGSLREGDTLVVYTTAILGRNKINATFEQARSIGAKEIHSLKGGSYPLVGAKGISVLVAAWSELEAVSKAQIADAGRTKGGRKKDPVWDSGPEIVQKRTEGMSYKELAEVYDTSEATVRRIVRFPWEKK